MERTKPLRRRSLRLVVAGAMIAATSAGATSALAHDPHPSLAPLAFMAGVWVHEDGGTAWEETWSAPTGDSMTGMTKWLEPDGTRMYEMQAIEVNDQGRPVLLIRHYGPGLSPKDAERDGAMEFTMSIFNVRRDDQGRFQSGRVAFARTDPRSNLPERILYVFPDPDSFTMTIEHGNNDDPDAWMAYETLTFHRPGAE